MTSLLFSAVGCGRSPSELLRVGQSPVFDFPLYVSEGASGSIASYTSERERSVLISGLSDPRGIATDKFDNLYVVEQGANQIIKVNVNDGTHEVIRDGLQTPSVVAVDSFGEAYVAQDDTQNVIRASDGEEIASFSSRPSALAFGVNDIMMVGLFDSNTVQWGVDGPTAAISEPVNISTDATGRVYIAEGSTSGASVFRYHQRSPKGQKTVVNEFSGPSGIAVDPVGNIYIIEQGTSRIILADFTGTLFNWADDVSDPQYLAFTQY